MALKEDIERSGNWLFRWRGYLPITLICAFLITMQQYEYPESSAVAGHLWGVLCLLISFVGLGLRALTIGNTPRDTSGRNTEKQEAGVLNTTGLYSIVRNPLYLGNFFMYLGVAVFTGIWWLVVIYFLVFFLYYERIIFAEEAYLRVKFGQQFLDWSDKTPAMIPRMSGYQKPALPFSFKNVLRREYNGFFAIILVMVVFEVVGKLVVVGSLEFDISWVVVFTFGFTTWIILRSLKKHSNYLDVEGR